MNSELKFSSSSWNKLRLKGTILSLWLTIMAIPAYVNANNDVTVSASTTKSKMTLDEYMREVIRRVDGEPSFSSEINPVLEVEGHLILHVGLIDYSRDPERFKNLYEAGIWESPDGPVYDLRKVTMTFPDGRGGINDGFTMLFGTTKLRFAKPKIGGFSNLCQPLLENK